MGHGEKTSWSQQRCCSAAMSRRSPGSPSRPGCRSSAAQGSTPTTTCRSTCSTAARISSPGCSSTTSSTHPGCGCEAAFIKVAADEPASTSRIEKVHRAAARASLQTGRADRGRSRPASGTGPRQVEILLEEGVAPEKIQIARAGDADDLDYIDACSIGASTSAWITRGSTLFLPTPQRNATVLELLRRGRRGAEITIPGLRRPDRQQASTGIHRRWSSSSRRPAPGPSWSMTFPVLVGDPDAGGGAGWPDEQLQRDGRKKSEAVAHAVNAILATKAYLEHRLKALARVGQRQRAVDPRAQVFSTRVRIRRSTVAPVPVGAEPSTDSCRKKIRLTQAGGEGTVVEPWTTTVPPGLSARSEWPQVA